MHVASLAIGLAACQFSLPNDGARPDAGEPPYPDVPFALVADADRDGLVTASDLPGRASWSWQGPGAFMLANIDDDDGDHTSDADNEVIDGPDDEADLAPLEVWLSPALLSATASVSLEVVSGGEHVRVFGDVTPAARIRVAIEARGFANGAWDGFAVVRAIARDAAGAELVRDQIPLRVAPWIMLPSGARAEEIHVATGPYANASFLDQLRAAISSTGATVRPPFEATRWQEMWMQDTMEVGYTQLPGRAPMHVALRANRGADSYPETLLAPDMGYLEVGHPRALSGGDDWADWYGNLEVSAPVPGWPLGRIYYGKNTTTGIGMHPDVVAFASAQEVQAPFWIDTSWLTIKHVDEIITSIADSAGTWHLLVASPRSTAPFEPVEYGPYNRGIQAKLDKMMAGGDYTIGGQTVSYPGVRALLGIGADDIIELPVLYTDGHNDWSNPVNALFVNGTYVTGNTYLPAGARQLVEARLGAVGVAVRFVNDQVYQDNLGNVHCATNATRSPIVPDYWHHLPDPRAMRHRDR